MNIITHQSIDAELCGNPVSVSDGFCEVEFSVTSRMAADDTGLVHGGFIFGAADYAAMLAVNHPNVVLGGANVQFTKPVKTDETVNVQARVVSCKGRKHVVEVVVNRNDETVFKGEFICFVLDKHVLDI